MSYQSDPRDRRPASDNTSYTGWIVGGLVALAVVAGIFMMTNRNASNIARNDTITVPRSTATVPAPPIVPPSTTGSAVPAEQAPTAR